MKKGLNLRALIASILGCSTARTVQIIALMLTSVLLSLQNAAGAAGMTESQALNTLFKAASGFASAKTPGWNHNTIFYVMWRQDRAEIERDCFWGKRGECLFKDTTDKEYVTALYKTFKDGEARHAGLQQWIREDPSALPYASYFVAVLLTLNIDRAYHNPEDALREGASTPSPELIVAYLGAVARKVREDSKQELAGWSVTDLLGWVVLYHPGLGKEMDNFAARIADVPIPYKETEGR